MQGCLKGSLFSLRQIDASSHEVDIKVVLYRLADRELQSSTLPQSPALLLQEQRSRLRPACKEVCCQTEASWGAKLDHLPDGDTRSPPSASRSTSAGASSASLREAAAGGLAPSAASPGGSVDGCSWGDLGPSAAGSPARSSVSSLSLSFSLTRASPGAACVPMLDLTTPRLISATGAANGGSSNGGSVGQDSTRPESPVPGAKFGTPGTVPRTCIAP